WSKSPEIVTFGAGAWANPGGASITRMTKASTAVTVNLRITALLKIVGEPQLNLVTASRGGHHQQLPGNGADEPGAMRGQSPALAVSRVPGRVVSADPIEGQDCLPRWTNRADRCDFSPTPY